MTSCLPSSIPYALDGPLNWGFALLPADDRQYFVSEIKSSENSITQTL